MRFVVLGATGYLGSKMVRMLTAQGHSVLSVGRRKESSFALFPDTDRISECMIETLDGELNSSAGYDWYLNFACRYARNGATDGDVFEANLHNPLRAFCTCYRHGIRRVMAIDTGLPDDVNVYSKSKALFADALEWYCSRDPALTVLNILLENFYGSDEPKDRFIHDVIRRLRANDSIPLTEGRQMRDFIHIDDVLSNLIHLIGSELRGYNDIPLGSGQGVSIRNLVEYLKDLTSSESELLFGAVKNKVKEPDSVADADIMDKYGIHISTDWKTGMSMLAGVKR